MLYRNLAARFAPAAMLCVLLLPTAALAQIGLPIDQWRDLKRSTRGTLVGLWRPRN